MNDNKNYGLYIDGEWINSVSGETFPSDNPAKPEQILGIFQKGNKQDIDKAVGAAEGAFEKWSETPAPKRGLILLKAAQLLRENKETQIDLE
jgi:aldehyde dehydrogenase (NAD+)